MNPSSEATVEALACMPWVTDHNAAKALATRGQPLGLARGESRDIDGPLVVLGGELSVEVSGRHGHCARPGRVLGLDALSGAIDHRVTALEPSVALLLPSSVCDDAGVVRSLLAASRSELSHALLRLDDAAHDADEVVTSPQAELVPGPYAFAPMPVLYFVMQREVEQVEALLPPGLKRIPALGGRYLVLVSDVQDCRSCHPRGGGRQASYRELTVFIPCLGPGARLGLYAPELFASATAPIMLGREIYGFPKRLGRIELDDLGATMACNGRLRFRARWRGTSPLSGPAFTGELLRILRRGISASRSKGHAHPIVERMHEAADNLGLLSGLASAQVFVRKRLPEPTAHARLRWAIDQLVRIPFDSTGITQAKRLEGLQVDLNPLASMAGHVVGGYTTHFGFRFGEATVVRNYLEPATQWRRWWTRP